MTYKVLSHPAVLLVAFLTFLVAFAYIRTIASGKILSKHKCKHVSKMHIIIFAVFIIVCGSLEQYFLKDFSITFIMVVYLLSIWIIYQLPIVTTNQGFFFKAQFNKWSDIINIELEDANYIRMTKLSMLSVDMNISAHESHRHAKFEPPPRSKLSHCHAVT